LFPGVDLTERYARFTEAGTPFGAVFTVRTRLSNSRLALEASEFARDAGRHHSFHARVFRAYFTDNLDIGDIRVILDLAQDEGLPANELSAALKAGRYAFRLEEAREEARQYGVTAVPTFIINGAARIVGAQGLDVFRREFDRLRQTYSGS